MNELLLMASLVCGQWDDSGWRSVQPKVHTVARLGDGRILRAIFGGRQRCAPGNPYCAPQGQGDYRSRPRPSGRMVTQQPRPAAPRQQRPAPAGVSRLQYSDLAGRVENNKEKLRLMGIALNELSIQAEGASQRMDAGQRDREGLANNVTDLSTRQEQGHKEIGAVIKAGIAKLARDAAIIGVTGGVGGAGVLSLAIGGIGWWRKRRRDGRGTSPLPFPAGGRREDTAVREPEPIATAA